MSPVQPLDESYFQWLYSQVADANDTDRSLTYWKLLRCLYTTEFTCFVPNDDNRLEDGKDLRLRFIEETGEQYHTREWMELGCSALELMVGLAKRMAFLADGEPHYWFWEHLMANIGLRRYSDNRRFAKHRVVEILDRVMDRTYDEDGDGGFFPLKNPQRDQRKVELWNQLDAYVWELELDN